jgi:hypothetical protein
MSKTIFIPEDLGRRCDWRTVRSRHGILNVSRKFHRKILGCARLLIGCHIIMWPSVSRLRVTFHMLWQHLHASYPSQARESVDSNLAVVREVLRGGRWTSHEPYQLSCWWPLILSMVALTDFMKGFPMMMEVWWWGSISMTIKSTKVEESWNSINTSFAIP